MRIIAIVNNNEILLSAHKDEVANIIGLTNTYEAERKNIAFGVSTTINVSGMYGALKTERSRKTDIATQAASLRRLADSIDNINSALDAAIIESPAQ